MTEHLDTAGRILIERRRQIAVEHYDWPHDDLHRDGELLYAAVAYLCTPGDLIWPFADGFKPSDDPVRNIVKAGALLSAEGDRLLRRQLGGKPVHACHLDIGIGMDENWEVIRVPIRKTLA